MENENSDSFFLMSYPVVSFAPGAFGQVRSPQPGYAGPYPGQPNYGAPAPAPGPAPAQKRLDPDAIPSPVSVKALLTS